MESRASGVVVPMPTRPAEVELATPVPVNVENERIGVMDVEVEIVHALIVAFGIVVGEEVVKFASPAFTVRRSACWSPIWREPRNPAFEKKVEEAMTEKASVDASPMVVDPVLKRLVDMERTEVVANVEVEVRAKSLSKVDEAERRTPTAVEVGRIANWESNVQSFVTPPEPSVPQVNLPVLAL